MVKHNCHVSKTYKIIDTSKYSKEQRKKLDNYLKSPLRLSSTNGVDSISCDQDRYFHYNDVMYDHTLM